MNGMFCVVKKFKFFMLLFISTGLFFSGKSDLYANQLSFFENNATVNQQRVFVKALHDFKSSNKIYSQNASHLILDGIVPSNSFDMNSYQADFTNEQPEYTLDVYLDNLSPLLEGSYYLAAIIEFNGIEQFIIYPLDDDVNDPRKKYLTIPEFLQEDAQSVILKKYAVFIHGQLQQTISNILDDYTIFGSQFPSEEGVSQYMKWHRIDLTFDGPDTAENAIPNPFRDYRLNVTFTHNDTGKSVVVPGYYAADGNAAETSADAGSKWRVHFTPDETGIWTYAVSFRQGADVAVLLDPFAGISTSIDGDGGSFLVVDSNKTGKDFRSKGMLRYVGKHHMQFADSKEYFLKAGADSPENFLGYYEFDNTQDYGCKSNALLNGLHHYMPHVQDYNTGDPTWQGEKGKGIIGALNYLSNMGMNSVYFLTMNVNGDGCEVFPWVTYQSRDRYDVSKLDQWEIVFSHMDQIGIMLHVVQQEQENDQLLNNGNLGVERKLYYRELIARFGHHLGVVWNLGEENTNTTSQRKAFADYIKAVDPYDHPVVVHTYPGAQDNVYDPLLGYATFDGPSMQFQNLLGIYDKTAQWVDESADNDKPWIVSLDEIGPANTGVIPDAFDANHDDVRKDALWANLMGGGAGVEWYFGYDYPHDDLDCEDWRTRENMWMQTRYAVEYFMDNLPFEQMSHCADLLSNSNAYCLHKPNQEYAIYLPDGGNISITLPEGNYSMQWLNPRTGDIISNNINVQSAGGMVNLGVSPVSDDVLIHLSSLNFIMETEKKEGPSLK